MIAPEVLSGLAAVSRVSRALVGTDELPVLAGAALEEMREALRLHEIALYLPDADGHPVLRRYVGSAAAEELSFDPEAWQLAIASGSPIVLREPATWLVANPFTPPANDWVILPLVTGEREMVGVVIASATTPIRIDPLSGTVLSLLGLQLSAGITTARLRRELLRAAMERERRTLAAEVHDGLAQYLAVARRELARKQPDHERLSEAVDSAHRLVRNRLQELSADAPADLRQRDRGRGQALQDRGAASAATARPGPRRSRSPPGSSSEALANADAHAHAQTVKIDYAATDDRLDVSIADDGRGFDPSTAPGVEDGHLGLTVMRERARGLGGECEITSSPDTGTLVTLWIPL